MKLTEPVRLIQKENGPQLSSGAQRVLVGLGVGIYENLSTTFEVIDLAGFSKISPIADFPFERASAFAGIGFNEEIIICQGRDASYSTKECYYYLDHGWNESLFTLSDYKVFASSASSMNNLEFGRIVVSGGYNGQVCTFWFVIFEHVYN